MQRHTAFLAAALTAAGADVEVVAPRGHDAGTYPFSVRTLEWPSRGPYPRTLWDWAGRCAEAVDGGGYDVIYGQGLTLLGRLQPGAPPSVFNPHGLELCTIPGAIPKLKAWPLRVGARRQIRQAARTISLGGRLTETLTRCLDVPQAEIVVIPNGVDPAYFTRSENERAPNMVLFVGRLFPNKGIDVLCEAVTHLPADIRVVIVGDGPLGSELRSRFRDPQIEFAGGVTEAQLHAFYREATLLALPTRSEGMPTVILEAMCCGTPIVATDVGAVAELVDDTTGVLIPAPPSPTELAAGLMRILELNVDNRKALGDAARRRVEERFSWSAVASQTLEVLEQVASE
jgi:glycosyltransferase involved in cell wall biosynthesis